MSASRANRFSHVGSLRSCASVKSADTQYSARWSLQEQVFTSGFNNIAFNKVGRPRRRKKWREGRGGERMVAGIGSSQVSRPLVSYLQQINNENFK